MRRGTRLYLVCPWLLNRIAHASQAQTSLRLSGSSKMLMVGRQFPAAHFARLAAEGRRTNWRRAPNDLPAARFRSQPSF